MTPRGTDWSLALLVLALLVTGLLSLVSGRPSLAWVFALHAVCGGALALVVTWKLRRVWRRIVRLRNWDRRTIVGVSAAVLVAGALASGVIWSSGGDLYVAGFNLLNWHIASGVALSLIVALHGLLRAKRPRRRDFMQRRQVLHAAGVTVGAMTAWWLQRPVQVALGWRGAERRWTGSYERGSFRGNAFPATSWVADRPRPLAGETYRLVVAGDVATPLTVSLAALHGHDTLTATLDCTGGFYSTQDWHGSSLTRLLAQAQPLPSARYLRVISHTGYLWSFPLAEARWFLLATAVGNEPLAHEHGAPVRLVAPGRRGVQWVKWVVRMELHGDYDYGAPASTVWSSWTAEGRGEPPA